METMNSSGLPVLFEEYITNINRIIVLILHQKQDKGVQQHMIMHVLVQMMLLTVLKVGFCRYYHFTGTSIFKFLLNISKFCKHQLLLTAYAKGTKHFQLKTGADPGGLGPP